MGTLMVFRMIKRFLTGFTIEFRTVKTFQTFDDIIMPIVKPEIDAPVPSFSLVGNLLKKHN